MKTLVVAGEGGPFLKKNVPDDEVKGTTKRLESEGLVVKEVRDE